MTIAPPSAPSSPDPLPPRGRSWNWWVAAKLAVIAGVICASVIVVDMVSKRDRSLSPVRPASGPGIDKKP